MGIDEKTINEIVDRILSVSRPARIILFGSAATGNMNRDSDIDLLIIEKQIENKRDEWIRIRKSLSDLNYPFDILIMNEERLEESKSVFGGIAFPANKYGKVIYEVA